MFLLLTSVSLSKAEEPNYIQVNLSNARVVVVDKGSSKKSFSQTRAPCELGLFALSSEAQNMIPYSARKN